MAPGVNVGNIVCATGAVFARLRLSASSIVKLVELRGAGRIGRILAAVSDALVLHFAIQSLQIALQWLRRGCLGLPPRAQYFCLLHVRGQ